jgi:deoxyribonuclease-1
MNKRLLRMLFIILLLLPAIVQAAGQQVHTDYFEALPVFWQQLYPKGGETLYCGHHFGKRKGRAINIEHVYPMSWVMKAEGCRSRDQCRRNSRRFNQIEADMHNLYPVRKEINKVRSSFPFGIIRGERRDYGKCDFEFDRRQRRVEPRPAARGNIARAMFYMQETYALKVYRRQGEMLQRWNRADPPDAAERRRNDRIEQIQGTRNRFIDNPKLADSLRF